MPARCDEARNFGLENSTATITGEMLHYTFQNKLRPQTLGHQAPTDPETQRPKTQATEPKTESRGTRQSQNQNICHARAISL